MLLLWSEHVYGNAVAQPFRGFGPTREERYAAPTAVLLGLKLHYRLLSQEFENQRFYAFRRNFMPWQFSS